MYCDHIIGTIYSLGGIQIVLILVAPHIMIILLALYICYYYGSHIYGTTLSFEYYNSPV